MVLAHLLLTVLYAHTLNHGVLLAGMPVLADLGTSIDAVTNYFRAFGAAVMGASITYGAFVWIFRGDEQARVTKAKELCGTGIIAGMVIFLAPTLSTALWNLFN